MITYITGIPGSGKSYFAVYKIWEEFIKQPKIPFFTTKKPQDFLKKYKYDLCYTNINKFDFDISDKIKSFDFDDFFFKLQILFNLYKSVDGKDDEVILKKCQELHFSKILLVLDECHNFFDSKENEVLLWYLTYHRHLYHDIILVTQDLSLICTSYKTVAEYFFRAVPASKRLFKNKFRYHQFLNYKMYAKDLISQKGIHIPILKDVFNLYQSGNNVFEKSIVKFYIYLFFVILFISFFLFYLFLEYLNPSDSNKNVSSFSNSVVLKNSDYFNTSKPSKVKNTYFYKIRCFNGYCFINNDSTSYPAKYFLGLFRDNPPIFLDSVDLFDGQKEYTCIFNEDIFMFLKKGNSKYEKDNFNSNFSSSSIFNSNTK